MCKFCMLFCFFCLTNFSSAQVIGKIFDRVLAEQEFGNVISFVEIKSNNIDSLLKNSEKYIMFNIDSGKIRAMVSGRISILGYAIYEEEVYYKFSSNKVEELLDVGNKEITLVEMRPKTLTLTNGNYTLEMSKPCPPFCGN